MENEKKHRPAPPQQEKQEEDIWTSAFDSQNGESADPPPFEVKAGTAQLQEKPGGHEPPVSPTLVMADLKRLHDILSEGVDDPVDAISVLRGKTIPHLKALRAAYASAYGVALELELQSQLDEPEFVIAMGLLGPALSLMQRLQLTKGFWDDNEEMMVAIIKAATPGDLAQARTEGIREFILDELDGMERYEMHKLAFPPAEFPGQNWHIALKTIEDGDNWFWDDDDFAYMVILDLTPEQRRRLWTHKRDKLAYLSASNSQIERLLLGSETEVVRTTMDLATDGPGTYDNLAEKTVNHVEAKVTREAELKKLQSEGDMSGGAELDQLSGMGDLVKARFEDGALDTDSLLGDLEGDLDEATFKAMAARLGMSQYEEAKRMILNAVSMWGDDERAMKGAFESLKDEALRRKLWVDPQVQAAMRAALNDGEKLDLAAYRDGDSYRIAEDKLDEYASRTFSSDGTQVEIIQLLVSLSPTDRVRLVTEHKQDLEKFTQVPTPLTNALKTAMETGKLSLEQSVMAASTGAGTSDELIESALDGLSDQEYAQLRLGYALEHGFQVPESLIPLGMQQAARHRYAWLMEWLQGEMGTDQLNETQDIFLKAPSLTELQAPGGMDMAAFILEQRIHDKMADRDGLLGEWLMDNIFSNTGGVMDARAMQALGTYYQGVADGSVGTLDLAAMAASYEEFDAAHKEQVAACDTAADIASTVAAIAVAIIVTIGTEGAGAPAAAEGLSAYIGSLSASKVVGTAVAAGAYKVAVQKAVGEGHFDLGDEGAKSFALGATDGALAAVTAGLARSLQSALFKAVGLEPRLASEMLVGEVISASDHALKLIGQQASVAATRGAIDGAISGAIGNLVLTASDEAAWRKGIWDTLATFGMALLQGGLMGAVTGGAMGAGMGALGGRMAVKGADEIQDFASRTGIDMDDLVKLNFERRRVVYDLSKKIGSDEKAAAGKLASELEKDLGKDPATRIQKHLYVANGKEVERPLVDAYMEQLIRLRGTAHALEQEQWGQLEHFFHGDPACIQTFIARSDEEMIYALRAAREETLDGAHGLSRHGPDVTDAKLERRVTGGFAPDGKISPAAPSTRFKSYKDFYETREAGLREISNGKGVPRTPINLSKPPGVGGNPNISAFEIVIEHSSRIDMAEGFNGVGTKYQLNVPDLASGATKKVNVWPNSMPISRGINRSKTSIEWNGARWQVKQHIPWARDFDFVTGTYTADAHVVL